MSHFNSGKNPPWARTSGEYSSPQMVSPQMVSAQINPQQLLSPAVVQYPQANATQAASVYQAQYALQQQALNMQQIVANNAQQIFNAQVTQNPTRQLNTAAFASPLAAAIPAPVAAAPTTSPAPTTSKQRVFTGIVTKIQDTFGFVDEEVFFQKSCCIKGSNPVVNDRVLVEAVYIANMPFKWNATRVQVLPMNDSNSSNQGKKTYHNSSSSISSNLQSSDLEESARRERDRRRVRSPEKSRERVAAPLRRRSPPAHDDESSERRRRRERRDSEDRDSRRRSRSPKKSRISDSRKYRMRIPEYSLHVNSLNVFDLRTRYSEMYIPSDFLCTQPKWSETFSVDNPLTIDTPSQFFIMNKDADSPGRPADNSCVLEPPDLDYVYSAKVMLLSFRSFEEIVSKCVPLAQDLDRDRDRDSSSFVHPTRLIHCLVGVNTRGKNETMAIGGPWSPSLDGADPVGDPNVLIKTAIRTCKALTGIDLKACTKWYRFAEIYYHRGKCTHKGVDIPSRVETVVIYIPDVWSLTPTRLEWEQLEMKYQLKVSAENGDVAGVGATEDEEEDSSNVVKREPTHYSLLDPKTMKVSELREELEARNISSKGLRLQLSARLLKVLKTEQDSAEEAKLKKDNSEEAKELGKEENVIDLEVSREEKEDEKNKTQSEDKFQLPDTPHILVYPSRTAKGGKYTCKKMSLSVLLDYRPGDNKEHSFEVSLFAELFNEMLMRDFGMRIYKAIVDAPEKEEKDEAEKDSGESDKLKDDDKSKDKEKSSKERDKSSKEREKSPKDKEIEDEKRSRRDRDKDRKRRDERRVKLYTADPMLLLSFVYFDVSRMNYIYDQDLERLLQILGLHLTRAQTKKLINKVLSVRDSSCNYRKLTDLPVTSQDANGEVVEADVGVLKKSPAQVSIDMFGVKCELPVFQTAVKDTSPPPLTPAKRKRRNQPETQEEKLNEGIVNYKGTLINIENLNEQVTKNQTARLETETRLVELKKQLDTVQDKSEKGNALLEVLRKELNKCKSQLEFTKQKLEHQAASSDVYLSVLMDIQERMVAALDPDEVKRLIKIRQDVTGTPSINLVPLTSVEDILKDEANHEDETETPVKMELS